jgi:hypothetical protein
LVREDLKGFGVQKGKFLGERVSCIWGVLSEEMETMFGD